MIAQNENEVDYFNDSLNIYSSKNLNKKFVDKLHFGVEAGTSVAIVGENSLFSTYVSPHVSFPVTNRFSVDIGLTVSQGNTISFINPYYSDYSNLGGQNLFQTSLFARGKYMLNNNLTVYGTTRITRSTLMNSFESNNNSDYDFQSMSLGLEYKFGNGNSIYFEIQKGNGFDQYNRNSFFPNQMNPNRRGWGL